ncbi:MAG: T9SS type A sorting domain-containing protein, partial [Ignavibacteria bacterium]|nr:T9SS type A sorting domain-containing protein [Ignavibacteria bacterium]
TSTIAPTLNIDGIRVTRTWGSVVNLINNSQVTERFSLSQNYPNPFNPSTKISFTLPERGMVTLKLFDVMGREIKELIKGNYNSGNYTFDLVANGMASGVYFYSIEVISESGNIYKDTRKLTLLK